MPGRPWRVATATEFVNELGRHPIVIVGQSTLIPVDGQAIAHFKTLIHGCLPQAISTPVHESLQLTSSLRILRC